MVVAGRTFWWRRGVPGTACVLALLLGAGCSWIGVKAPLPGQGPGRCTSSDAAPIVDTGMAVLGGLAALGGLGSLIGGAVASRGSGEHLGAAIAGIIGAILLGAGGITGAAYGFSARDGFRATRECRALRGWLPSAWRSRGLPPEPPSPPSSPRSAAPAASAPSGATAAAAATAPAPGPAIWDAPGRGTVVVSPVRPGAVIDLVSSNQGAFSFFTDFDYYLTPNIAMGAILSVSLGPNINSGISGAGYQGFGIGPQLKLLNDSPDHVPYLRLALPFRTAPAGYGASAWYGLGLLQIGGGYRYWFHRRVGIGFDASAVPTLVLGKPGGPSFFWGFQLSSGIELRL